MFDVREISAAEAAKIIATEETHFSDVKDIRIKPGKLSRTVSAFANASGGEILLGISEDKINAKRSWEGFLNREAANDFVSTLEKLAELNNHYTGVFLKSAGQNGLILHLTIFRTQAIVKSSDGSVYVRRNASNLPYDTPAKLKQLDLDKGIITFENETVAIESELVVKSATAKRFLANIAPNAARKPAAWFKGELLISNGRPLVAAVLLFADNPQAALPKRSAVKLFRYKTSNKEGSRDTLDGQPQTIEGPIYDLIANSVKATKKLVEGIKRLGPQGLEPIDYPHETLHEIVTNAILHRDYSIQTDIQIRVFDNRIEVESPGKFPGHVTSQNFLVNQAARNGKIVRLINKFANPPNKDIGEGLNTAFAAMKKLRLKEPYVTETDNSLIFYIEHTPLASPAEMVMDYLDTHDAITNEIARNITGISSENSMKNVFLKLKQRGLIDRVPGLKGNKAAWQKFDR